MMKLPSLSIVIPTLNSAKTLGLCLESIKRQEFPKDLLEVLIVDGGSSDETLDIALKYRAKIIYNKLKTGEAGKAAGIKKASKQIVALIDSDNVLPEKNWIKKMVKPFFDKSILASEPLYFNYDKKDSYINRYCSLLGMNDPLCFFTGNYDRYSYLSGKWTNIKLRQSEEDGYISFYVSSSNLPTIGANGFFVRKELLNDIGNYFFDVDFLISLTEKRNIKIAKVKTTIVHLYCDSVYDFIRKQKRRVRDYLYYQKKGQRVYPWKSKKYGIIKFSFFCLTIIPLVWQSVSGYFKKPDTAWFFHPTACLITFYIYSSQFIKSRFISNFLERGDWQT